MMERKDFFKAEYEASELQELFEWFEKHMEQLPRELQLDDATYTRDLPRTVRSYVHLLQNMRRTISQGGYVAHLMLIRERLRDEGLIKD